ncbi:transposase [Nitrosospira multiformis]|uniref:transposase n=1 Tax=Nitrosospira TaxID=35798 RepID=UPI000D318A95
MKKSRFSKEQIINALRLADSGSRRSICADRSACRRATFYMWKENYADLGVS